MGFSVKMKLNGEWIAAAFSLTLYLTVYVWEKSRKISGSDKQYFPLPCETHLSYSRYRQYSGRHRRRMGTEAKAKVAVWGAKFVQFLAALSVLPQSTVFGRNSRNR